MDESTPTAPLAPLLVDIRKAAKALGISQRTFWSIVQRGEIPSIKCGRRRLFDPRDLVAWVGANKRSATDGTR